MTNINLNLNLNATVNLNFSGVQGTAYPMGTQADQNASFKTKREAANSSIASENGESVTSSAKKRRKSEKV